MAAKNTLGAQGEAIAARYLEHAGFVIIDRNWRCHQGEIDLIARDGDELVFVEVKTRSSVLFGHPLEAITARKLSRLKRLAAAWCEQNPGDHSRIRIDAVGIIVPPTGDVEVEHLERVF
ncbi:MAG: YraN family protein [Rhodoglobus sp.]